MAGLLLNDWITCSLIVRIRSKGTLILNKKQMTHQTRITRNRDRLGHHSFMANGRSLSANVAAYSCGYIESLRGNRLSSQVGAPSREKLGHSIQLTCHQILTYGYTCLPTGNLLLSKDLVTRSGTSSFTVQACRRDNCLCQFFTASWYFDMQFWTEIGASPIRD
jgi:hypothetical protein